MREARIVCNFLKGFLMVSILVYFYSAQQLDSKGTYKQICTKEIKEQKE